MIAITENEKKAICKMLPGVHIARTMKQRSSRHRYYLSEEPAAVQCLRELREGQTRCDKDDCAAPDAGNG